MTTPEEARKDLEWAAAIAEENHMHKLSDRLRDLANQVEALQADAERYRWIRNKTYARKSDFSSVQWFQLPDAEPLSNIFKGSVAQHLDAAIDAARKAK